MNRAPAPSTARRDERAAKEAAPVLVASDSVGDADVVAQLLGADFANVFCSTDPARAVADFEARLPSVLVLAFDAVERAERYYLGLYRLSPRLHAHPHRTVILCHKDEVQHVYALCRQEHFDDYVLFWPHNHDALRLPMSVHQALRALAADGGGPSAADFAASARRLGAAESGFARLSAQGSDRLDAADRTLRETRAEIGSALEGLAQRLNRPEWHDVVEIKDVRSLEVELARVRSHEVEPRMNALAGSLQPVRAWADSVRREAAARSEPVRALQRLAESVQPLVLIVDDDEFQLKIVRQLLADSGVELAEASNGASALAALRKRRFDVVLLDIGLPDVDGVELARCIKAIPALAGVSIVMITGHSDKDVVVQSIKAGAAGFVVKPLAKETLLRQIRACLGGATEAATPAGVAKPA